MGGGLTMRAGLDRGTLVANILARGVRGKAFKDLKPFVRDASVHYTLCKFTSEQLSAVFEARGQKVTGHDHELVERAQLVAALGAAELELQTSPTSSQFRLRGPGCPSLTCAAQAGDCKTR